MRASTFFSCPRTPLPSDLPCSVGKKQPRASLFMDSRVFIFFADGVGEDDPGTGELVLFDVPIGCSAGPLKIIGYSVFGRLSRRKSVCVSTHDSNLSTLILPPMLSRAVCTTLGFQPENMSCAIMCFVVKQPTLGPLYTGLVSNTIRRVYIVSIRRPQIAPTSFFGILLPQDTSLHIFQALRAVEPS